ncbi:MAG: cob(I)yrinic acid a,c-diamide adenosyltransferase [Butyrivibrio sp.]|nr:cob(I)yrinic acid a,c-diamide adenosyltransferase [Butyrivibrio sp.]
MSDNDRIGLTHLYTGDGKGKTTAAVGLAIRALGNGKKVIFTQFMKGRETGEVNCLAGINGIKIIRNDEDLGWYRRGDEKQAKAFTRLHNSTLEQIEELIATGEWDMVIMDEITYPYNYGIIDKERLQNLILKKPKYLELVLTGRNPDQFFIDHADYITEMKKIRHPYDKGISAREGIEC